MNDIYVGMVLGALVWHGVIKILQFIKEYDKQTCCTFSRKKALTRAFKSLNPLDV
jgi:hypothetical protein